MTTKFRHIKPTQYFSVWKDGPVWVKLNNNHNETNAYNLTDNRLGCFNYSDSCISIDVEVEVNSKKQHMPLLSHDINCMCYDCWR